MDLNLTDGAALIAILISVVSAISADRSASSAESSAESAIYANHLAQHNERLAIYKALHKFHMELQTQGSLLQDARLWEFAPMANISEFYFPQAVAADLEQIVQAANEYLAMRNLWKTHQEGGSAEAARNALLSTNAIGARLRGKCAKCEDDLRGFLRLEPKADITA